MLFLTELHPSPVTPNAAAHAAAHAAHDAERAINPAGASEHKPALSFAEGPEAWWLTLEVPGMTAETLELTLADDHLTVRGEKGLPQVEGLVWHHNERTHGPFERVLKLPSDADQESIQAETKHGLLTVRVAKLPLGEAQKIQIVSR